MSFGWEFPPGVSGSEPQITGEWRCFDCNAVLPEVPSCPECAAGDMTYGERSDSRGDWEVFACDSCGHTIEADFETCPGGCDEGPDPDDARDRQYADEQGAI